MVRRAITLVVMGLICNLSFSQGVKYMPNSVILKVKPEFRGQVSLEASSRPELKLYLEKIQTDELSRKFPNHNAQPVNTRSPEKDKKVDLSLIYNLHYDEEVEIAKVISRLKSFEVFEYVEPWIIPEVSLFPSDEFADSMWHLPVIKAFDAWDIDTGGSNITIAIVDTGVDYAHPDLGENIWYNIHEVGGDGEDNDSNDFTDDFVGWNFYNNNSDPMETGFSHGTHVAGSAGAVPNMIGVIGTGYNCKIMCIKSGDKLELPYGYEGIIYAADMGANVINLSWGSNAYTEYGHEVVRYAYNKGAVMTGGAGNDNRQNAFYPASFPEVISVGSTEIGGGKSDFSNYGYLIDLMAPGTAILSLKNSTADVYGFDNGTSMSAPIVAGAAALVMHKYPSLTPAQVIAQLKETADKSIYQNDSNLEFVGKMGAGLLDMERALDTISTPSVAIEFIQVTDHDDDIFNPGELVDVGIELVNYLNPTGNVTVKLVSLVENVTVIEGEWNAGSIATLGRINNISSPFKVYVDSLKKYNQDATVRFDISDGTYSTSIYKQFVINPDYVNVAVNSVKTSVTKHGLVGFTDLFHTYGLGFQLDTHGNLLYEAGLMIGHENFEQKRVADRVRSDELFDRDFWPMEVIHRTVPQGEEAYRAVGRFSDTSAITDEIGLEIRQKVVAYQKEGHRNYVIVDYTIHNVSGDDLNDVYAGVFADWDIKNYDENRAGTAYGKRLGYVYHTGNEELTGAVQALSDIPFYSYMIDNTSDGAGGIVLYDTDRYSTADKYLSLTSERRKAGENGLGNDVCQVISVGPMDIPNGDSVNVAFAYHAATNIEDVLASADSAYQQFYSFLPGENIFAPFQLRSVRPNPAIDYLTLEFDLKEKSAMDFYLIDISGAPVSFLEETTLFPGFNEITIDLPPVSSGLYFVRIESDDFYRTIPLEIIR
ncbi:MAG: S8 family serine peptidase [Flavobacteriales bacterium]|jgi:serine protease|nr:S8 family serine peptidase [Flavobacteriales bacterium]MBT3962808.1 S8 family serine peptidase [Flavobacteriales bacterium]MBT4704025.1 S8 family serine peptidase [Flavobacteriales bacterium]MBT4930279.1 S8 family serine peptidase [Flavobacteriales bacterium]MBT5132502.1 S8 family serine peptidase [Flavobacteriales bacterium]